MIGRDKASRKDTGGNALFLILIAVALFAALGYAITQSSRGGGNINRETADLDAANLVMQSHMVASTVDRLLLSGCTKAQISFEGAGVDADAGWPAPYVNAAAPADGRCHVYGANGGGLAYTAPSSKVLDTTMSAENLYGLMLFVTNLNIAGSSFDGGGSYMVHILVPYINDATCSAINRRLFNFSSVPQDTEDGLEFINSFSGAGGVTSGGYIDCETTDLGSTQCGGTSGCFHTSTINGAAAGNVFYQDIFRIPP